MEKENRKMISKLSESEKINKEMISNLSESEKIIKKRLSNFLKIKKINELMEKLDENEKKYSRFDGKIW